MIVRKTTHSSDNASGLEFVLSDATVDRYGDSIDATGWDLRNFKNNPIALFGHDSRFPIGTWKDLHVKDGALRGHLQVAPSGTSPRIDEIRALIAAGILRAVSVGFKPIESEPLVKTGGTRYLKSELIETSLVSVPANPNALQVSKSLGVSNATLRMVFRDKRGKRKDDADGIDPPDDGESYEDFMDRCTDATDEDTCQTIWDERAMKENNKTIRERIADARDARATLASLKRANAVLKQSQAREDRDQAAKKAKERLKNIPPIKPPDTSWGAHDLDVRWNGKKIPTTSLWPSQRKPWDHGK